MYMYSQLLWIGFGIFIGGMIIANIALPHNTFNH